MKSLPTNLIIAKNRLDCKYPWLLLLEVHLNDDADTVRRFVRSGTDGSGADISYGGEIYTAFNFDIGLIRQSAEADVPTTRLSVCNISQFLEPDIQATDELDGASVKIIIVHADNLDEDHSELELEYDIISPAITATDVTFTLGAPSPLRRNFPMHRYFADFCWHYFEDARCGYTGKAVAGVTLAGSDPVSVECTGHGFADNDVIRLADIAGVTPSMAGNYAITKTDNDNFTLNSTDSSDYSGSYTSGGTAGYAVCPGHLSDCRDRENSSKFGGFVGLKDGGIKFA